MHVFIATMGTRGDVQPYLALGAALQQAGHRVTVCTSTRYAAIVAAHGFRFGRLSDDLVALVETPEGRAAIAGAGGRLQEMGTLFRILNDSLRIQRELLRDGWHAAQEAAPDVVVYHPKMAIALHYAERLGIPAVMTLLYPALLPTRAYPNPGFPNWPLGACGAGAYNRATHRLVRGTVRTACRWLFADWRAAQGLPPQPRGTGLLRRSNGTRVPVLNAWSRHVAPDPPDWPSGGIATTGYWRLPQEASWTPPAGLQAFLDAGPPPVYVGFGSMAGADPARTTRTVVRALRRAGYRGVLARGWGGLQAAAPALPESIYVLDDAPHDALFPHMAAVVHHGGAGTTAAGLRAGCPTVVCPFFGDQRFWAQRVHDLGAGPPPIPHRALTAERLSDAIRYATETASVRRAVQSLGTQLRSENGAARAAAHIAEIAATGHVQPGPSVTQATQPA